MPPSTILNAGPAPIPIMPLDTINHNTITPITPIIIILIDTINNSTPTDTTMVDRSDIKILLPNLKISIYRIDNGLPEVEEVIMTVEADMIIVILINQTIRTMVLVTNLLITCIILFNSPTQHSLQLSSIHHLSMMTTAIQHIILLQMVVITSLDFMPMKFIVIM